MVLFVKSKQFLVGLYEAKVIDCVPEFKVTSELLNRHHKQKLKLIHRVSDMFCSFIHQHNKIVGIIYLQFFIY